MVPQAGPGRECSARGGASGRREGGVGRGFRAAREGGAGRGFRAAREGYAGWGFRPGGAGRGAGRLTAGRRRAKSAGDGVR
jgi:hypothetical protein